MPGKQPRVLCPVCQEPIPPDETECENCGAFVIDEAVVRLSRALGLDREKALKLFEAGFRHPRQLGDRDPNRVLEKGEVGLLFICTNCGGFVASGDPKCPRCAAEFETEPEELAPEEDILDLVLCPVCGADNDPDFAECEVCGEPLKEGGTPPPEPGISLAKSHAPEVQATEEALGKVVDFLQDTEAKPPEPIRPLAVTTPPRSKPPEPAPHPVAPSPEPPSPAPSRPSFARPAPVAPKPLSKVVPPPPVPREERPKAAPAVPTSRTPYPRAPRPRIEPVAPSTPPPPIPSVPTKRVRAAPTVIPGPRKTAKARRMFPLSPEMAGGLVLAAAVGLVIAGVLDQPIVGAGIALVLTALAGGELADVLRASSRIPSRFDATLLAAGVVLGLSVPILGSTTFGVAGVVALALASTAFLAAVTVRLHAGPQRILLAVAGALPLAGQGLIGALDPTLPGTLPWTVGIGVAAPWPAALTIAELRRRKSTSVVRRELIRAERDIARRNYEQSLQEYDRAIAASRTGVPGAEIPWYGKGATLVLLGRYEEALRAIDKALDINPRNEVAWVNKGNALTRMGRLVDALRCFNAAIKVNPTYEVAWNNKGNALARLTKFDESLRCYERALEIDSGYRGAWVNMGFVLTKLGRFDEAASCADRALRLEPWRRADPT